ncbi:MAG TPA: polyphosphate kinase 1 [Longimicrobium sp.]|nr:polyphosphate kinase 1 [Longimicrobium sp.]
MASREPIPLDPPAAAPKARYDPGDPATLEQLATGPLPEGLQGGAPSRTYFRHVYFDTEQGDLERRGAWARVTFHEGGVRTATVRTGRLDGPGERAEAELPDGEGEPFPADSRPGRLLRSLTDPARLVPRVELEVERRVREVRGPGGRGAELVCDAVTARDGDLRADFSEMEVRSDGRGARDPIAAALRHAYGLPRLVQERLDRARMLLHQRELDLLEEAVRGARRVAIVAVDDGRIALRRDRATLRVPSGDGAGEEACRRVLRDCFGHDGARVRLLGTGVGSADRPGVEVWLAEGVRDAATDAECEVVHVPLAEVLASVGSPALRERDTLAALHVIARSAVQLVPTRRGDRGQEQRARETLAAVEPADADRAAELPPGTLLNMELSLLAFNRRVLGLAEDPSTPLLERLRFLGIFGANTDEFFRVRVAGFKRQVALGSTKPTIDGVTPQEQLDAIGVRARRLIDRAYDLLFRALTPELAAQGVEIVFAGEWTDEERDWLREMYERQVHPVLTPLMAGPGSPFPHIRNLRPGLAAMVRDPAGGGERLGIVELPDGLPRFARLPGGTRLAPLEEVIRGFLPDLYPGLEVEPPHAFRVTRSAELHLRDREVEDLLHEVEEQVRKRRFRPVVRLEVEREMPEAVWRMLLRELQYEAPGRVSALGEQDVYAVERLVDLSGLRELAEEADVGGAELRYPPAPPPRTPLEPRRPVFDALRERDVLVSFPEDSFEQTVERLVIEAAEDPDVLAVKLALYRTNKKSRIVEALTRASSRGKQVVALVELTARFDEQSNIHWARYLRSYGIHVIYGVPGLKVHAKIALIVRREGPAIRRYVYIGTGNLNASTAGFYTDLGLLTASPNIAEEINVVFNLLTGGGGPAEFRHLLVAPYNMRERFVALIDREAEHARHRRGGWIRAKFNGLADREIIAALYRASRAGVRIELLVRGICSLRPGLAGVSENIHVYSLLGRHLEHARIFRFGNAGQPEYYIGSGDWRTRNLSKRVEVAVPIIEPGHRARLDAILEADLARPDAWELGADGTYYQRPEPAPRETALPPADPDRVPIITT